MKITLTDKERSAIDRTSQAAYWNLGDDYELEDLFKYPGPNDMLHLIKAYEKLFILREFIKYNYILNPQPL